MRPCFTFKAATATKPAVVAIDDEIGLWGLQHGEFRQMLDGVAGQDLDVEINSPGGDVMAGLGMYHMLRSASANGVKVRTRVTGVAASIASIVLMAGDEREMPKNSFGMVHSVKGWQGNYATANEMRDLADATEKIHNQVKQIYIERAGIDEAKATELMAKDNWLTASECLDLGLATKVVDEVKAVAKFDVERADMPAHVAAVFKAAAPAENTVVEGDPAAMPSETATVSDEPIPPVADQVTAIATAAGFAAYAPQLALAHASVNTAKARISELTEIAALCKVTKRDDYLAVAVNENKSLPEVRTLLVEALAATDKHTDTTQSAHSNGGTTKPGVNTSDLWASHNSQRKKDR